MALGDGSGEGNCDLGFINHAQCGNSVDLAMAICVCIALCMFIGPGSLLVRSVWPLSHRRLFMAFACGSWRISVTKVTIIHQA